MTQPTREQIADAIRDAACTGDCNSTEEECAKTRIQPFVWHHGRLAVVEGAPEMFADVVLGLLPAPVDRAAVLTEAADAVARDRQATIPVHSAWAKGMRRAEELLRRLAAEAHTDTQDDVPVETEYRVEAQDGDTWKFLAAPTVLDVARAIAADYLRGYPEASVRILHCTRTAVVVEQQGATPAVSSSPVSAAPRHDEEALCFVVEPHAAHDWLPFPGSGLVAKGVVHCPGHTEEAAGE